MMLLRPFHADIAGLHAFKCTLGAKRADIDMTEKEAKPANGQHTMHDVGELKCLPVSHQVGEVHDQTSDAYGQAANRDKPVPEFFPGIHAPRRRMLAKHAAALEKPSQIFPPR